MIAQLASMPSGLVLVTGPTGSGKTTTLAAMIDKINAERRYHILTIEDPIEFLHPNKLSVVNQREVGTDTAGFKDALRYALRQDPDVVLIGELRDLETIEAALTISETGHLVFGTLHTNSAVQSINRIIDVFPPHQQPQIRAQLSFVLQGVITQTLVPNADGPGRALAHRDHDPERAIRNLIREDKVHQIYSVDADRPVDERHADHEPVALQPVHAAADHARRSRRPLARARRARGDDAPRADADRPFQRPIAPLWDRARAETGVRWCRRSLPSARSHDH